MTSLSAGNSLHTTTLRKDMKEVKAVLFDMDGLIFDTEGLYKACWQYAAEEQGLVITDADYQSFIGVQDVECERRVAKMFGDQH